MLVVRVASLQLFSSSRWRSCTRPWISTDSITITKSICCKQSIQKVLQILHKHKHNCATNIQTSPTCPSHPPSCSCTPAFSSVDRPPTSPSVEQRSFHELQFEAMIMRMGILMRVRRITLCAVYNGLQFEVFHGALIQLDVIFFTLLGKSLQSAPGSVGIKLILSCCSGFNDFVTWSVNFEAFLRKFLCRCDLGPACKVKA